MPTTLRQGFDVQMGTNCHGHWLFTSFLAPLLESTAQSSPANTVRVAWAGSLVIDANAPKNGLTFADDGSVKVLDVTSNYAQSKAGNYFMASEFAKLHPSIVSVVSLHLSCQYILKLITFVVLQSR